MLRATVCALVFALLAGLALMPVLSTEEALSEEAEKAPAKLTLASDEKAEAVLAVFKEDWKAKGLRGEDKVMQRDFAMRKISKIHHPDIVAALGKASRDSHPDVRMIALIYLGDQKALTHLAAQHVLKAMRKHKKDIVLQMTGLQTLGELRYLGLSLASQDRQQLEDPSGFPVRDQTRGRQQTPVAGEFPHVFALLENSLQTRLEHDRPASRLLDIPSRRVFGLGGAAHVVEPLANAGLLPPPQTIQRDDVVTLEGAETTLGTIIE